MIYVSVLFKNNHSALREFVYNNTHKGMRTIDRIVITLSKIMEMEFGEGLVSFVEEKEFNPDEMTLNRIPFVVVENRGESIRNIVESAIYMLLLKNRDNLSQIFREVYRFMLSNTSEPSRRDRALARAVRYFAFLAMKSIFGYDYAFLALTNDDFVRNIVFYRQGRPLVLTRKLIELI